MKLRIAGMSLYVNMYLLACYAHFGANADVVPAVSGAAAIVFGALAAAKTDASGRPVGVAVRLFSLLILTATVLGMFQVLPMAALIMMQASGLLVLAFEWRGGRTWAARAGIALLAIPAVACVPVPGFQVAAPAAPTEYAAAAGQGRIAAPNVTERVVLAGELYRASWNRAEAAEGLSLAPPLDADGLSAEDFGDLYELPFEVPASFYEVDGASTDPHALMKTLAGWNATNAEDATQGQFVMGVGTVAPDGTIGMVEHIEAYTEAALRAEPKVFFVPVAAYEQVRDIDKDLLVVPVSRFEEVLYFLSQPVTFWPLRNFGLFCH